jgi:hypothetical protein
MKLNLEKFTAAGRRFSSTISVRSNGALGISQGALHQAKISDAEWHVVLFYDRANKVIGIKPTRDSNEEGSIKLSVRVVKKEDADAALSAFVAAKSFFNFYGIPHSKTTSYRANWDSESGMLIAYLVSDQAVPSSSDPDENEPTTMTT